jgi:hypothetical protein
LDLFMVKTGCPNLTIIKLRARGNFLQKEEHVASLFLNFQFTSGRSISCDPKAF